jgi:hypothetical protein
MLALTYTPAHAQIPRFQTSRPVPQTRAERALHDLRDALIPRPPDSATTCTASTLAKPAAGSPGCDLDPPGCESDRKVTQRSFSPDPCESESESESSRFDIRAKGGAPDSDADWLKTAVAALHSCTGLRDSHIQSRSGGVRVTVFPTMASADAAEANGARAAAAAGVEEAERLGAAARLTADLPAAALRDVAADLKVLSAFLALTDSEKAIRPAETKFA